MRIDLAAIEQGVRLIRAMVTEPGYKPMLVHIAKLMSYIDELLSELKNGKSTGK